MQRDLRITREQASFCTRLYSAIICANCCWAATADCFHAMRPFNSLAVQISIVGISNKPDELFVKCKAIFGKLAEIINSYNHDTGQSGGSGSEKIGRTGAGCKLKELPA